MKILWVGDAVCSSGFARCTHAACDALSAAGHEVHVLGINYWGEPHGYDYPIYPCVTPLDGGRDAFGVTRLPVLTERIKPDVVVLLNDPWNIAAYLGALGEDRPLVAAWLAVDGKNQRGHELNELDKVITWTQFAIDELKRGGYKRSASIVPLGVEGFAPVDKARAREAVLPKGIAPDAFIVGVVGRNQPRKRLDLTLEYFAEWGSDAYLYLHVAPTGDSGCDVTSLVRYYGLQGRVILSEPHIGEGLPTAQMPLIYSAFDVYWTTTQGEGWGLPCMEAMACGVPCLVPDYSALGEWTEDAALKVPCTSSALTAPMNSRCFTIGGIADKAETVKALERLRTDEALRADLSRKGLELTARPEYQWGSVGARMTEELENLVGVTRLEVAQ